MNPRILNYVTEPARGRHKTLFGNRALVTKLGDVNIVHLDGPDEQTIQHRIKEVIEEELSGNAVEDDCPLCKEIKSRPYDVIFDGLEE